MISILQTTAAALIARKREIPAEFYIRESARARAPRWYSLK